MNEIRERAERVEQWANLHGDDLAGALRLDDELDAAAIKVVEDALWCAHDVLALTSAGVGVSRG